MTLDRERLHRLVALGLPLGEARVLLALRARPGSRAVELARALRVPRARAAAALAALRGRGVVLVRDGPGRRHEAVGARETVERHLADGHRGAGHASAAAAFAEAAATAQREVLVLARHLDFLAPDGGAPPIPSGVRARLITDGEHPLAALPGVAALARPLLPLSFLVVDDAFVVVAAPALAVPGGVGTAASSRPGVVDALARCFDDAWAAAARLAPAPRARAPGGFDHLK